MHIILDDFLFIYTQKVIILVFSEDQYRKKREKNAYIIDTMNKLKKNIDFNSTFCVTLKTLCNTFFNLFSIRLLCLIV
jgi:hypothetical protein